MLQESQKKQKKPKIKISSKVKDHSSDPFIVKKNEESIAFLEKHGFPKEVMNRK